VLYTLILCNRHLRVDVSAWHRNRAKSPSRCTHPQGSSANMADRRTADRCRCGEVAQQVPHLAGRRPAAQATQAQNGRHATSRIRGGCATSSGCFGWARCGRPIVETGGKAGRRTGISLCPPNALPMHHRYAQTTGPWGAAARRKKTVKPKTPASIQSRPCLPSRPQRQTGRLARAAVHPSSLESSRRASAGQSLPGPLR